MEIYKIISFLFVKNWRVFLETLAEALLISCTYPYCYVSQLIRFRHLFNIVLWPEEHYYMMSPKNHRDIKYTRIKLLTCSVPLLIHISQVLINSYFIARLCLVETTICPRFFSSVAFADLSKPRST